MGRLLTGEFELEILGLRIPLNPVNENPNDTTARYRAKVIKTDAKGVSPGDIVSVRMVHHGHADDYIGMTGIFNGDVNDIQDDINSEIDTSYSLRNARVSTTYINPFGAL